MLLLPSLSCWYPMISLKLHKNGFDVTARGDCPVNTDGKYSTVVITYKSEYDFPTRLYLKKGQSKYSFSCEDVEGQTVEQCKAMMKKWQWKPAITLQATFKVPHSTVEGVEYTVETGVCLTFVISVCFWLIVAIFLVLVVIRIVFCSFYLKQYWTAYYQREALGQEKKKRQETIQVANYNNMQNV